MEKISNTSAREAVSSARVASASDPPMILSNNDDRLGACYFLIEVFLRSTNMAKKRVQRLFNAALFYSSREEVDSRR